MARSPSPTNAFRFDCGGNVSTVFVALALPLVVAAGGALDFAMGVNMKTKMQNALDAATTAVCSDPSKDPEEVLRDRLSASIGEFGLELMPPPDPEAGEQPPPEGNQALVLNTAFNFETGAISPSLETNMPTNVLGIVGMDSMNVVAMTSVQCGSKRLELSLMLDVTGSMGWTANGVPKIDSLKEAANDVFDIFQFNMGLGSARIALVPFAEAVNVGPTLAPVVRGTPPSSKTFTKWNGDQRTYQLTNCVTERVGAHAYTDQAPGSGSYVGAMYNSYSGCKPGTEIMPLTNDVDALRAAVNGFQASGSTAGHLGTAWSWYLISESWAGLFPTENQPEARNDEELIKATILMTDGEYNTEYCEGVKDNTINCTAPNGNSKAQAEALCDAMKTEGVVVYAVGFGLDPSSSTAQRLKDCATDDDKWFFPYDGDQLRAAFQSIGQSLAAGQAGQAVVNQ